MRSWTLIAALALMGSVREPDTYILEITVTTGRHGSAEPLCVPITLPDAFADATKGALEAGADWFFPVQVTRPGLLSPAVKIPPSHVQRELHFNKSFHAEETRTYKVAIYKNPTLREEDLCWYDKPGEYEDLRAGSRPILRYVYRALDESTKESRAQTYKVFHHLFDPAGKRLITNGPAGRYPHHRGIFYGWNKVTYGSGKSCDIWHCPNAHQGHEKFLGWQMGEILGRRRVQIGWYGLGKELFAREEREVTVYTIAGGTLLEFVSRLTPVQAPVKLDGDPQHAGFHFRADNEVNDKTAKETYFVRPDGVGKPGETRNWPAQKEHVNLPWDAMSFVLGEKRYTVAYLDRPQNPKEARFSERDYGRFGSYFVYTLEEGKVLDVRYRLWLQEGEMKPEEVAAKSADFVDPPKVTVK